MRASLIALTLLLPLGLSAATVDGSRSFVVSEPSAGNAYFYGGDLSVGAPVSGDLMAAGGNVTVSAPVSGDALLAGGSVDVRKPVSGDVRAFGGRITLDDTVGGDVVALGGSVSVASTPAFAWVGGVSVSFTNGAHGPVTIYGSAVTLAGTFDSDVDVVTSDRLTIADGTVIKGHLRYDAPQQVDIPTTATIGSVIYTGKSFLPTTQEAQSFAVAGASIFFLVRILAAIIAAGLLAGLFPALAQAVVDRAIGRSFNRFILLALLGFGVLVATPVLIVLLVATFAGVALAFLLLAAYILLFLLSYVYAAIIAGGALARAVAKRSNVLWRDAVFGMLALSIITLVPIIGGIVLVFLFAAACGALVSLLYRFAFPRDEDLFDLG